VEVCLFNCVIDNDERCVGVGWLVGWLVGGWEGGGVER
jgi:hypothetical protein